MFFSKLWGPGLRLMRHLSFTAKFVLVAVLSLLPLLFVLWQIALGDGSKDTTLEFGHSRSSGVEISPIFVPTSKHVVSGLSRLFKIRTFPFS